MSIYHLIYYFILQCIYTLALLFSSIHIHSCFIVFVVGSLLSWYGISYVGFNTYTFAVCLLIGCLERLRAIFCFAGESVRVVIMMMEVLWFGLGLWWFDRGIPACKEGRS